MKAGVLQRLLGSDRGALFLWERGSLKRNTTLSVWPRARRLPDQAQTVGQGQTKDSEVNPNINQSGLYRERNILAPVDVAANTGPL